MYEMDEYVCGVNGKNITLKAAYLKVHGLKEENSFRRTNLSSRDSDMDSEGRKVEPPSTSMKRLKEETTLYRRP